MDQKTAKTRTEEEYQRLLKVARAIAKRERVLRNCVVGPLCFRCKESKRSCAHTPEIDVEDRV